MITLTTPDVAKIIRQSRTTLDAVMRGDVDAMLAVGNVFRTVMIEELRQPGTGRTYTTEWRMIKGRPVPINKPRVGGAHTASAPGRPPATDYGTLKNNLAVAITTQTNTITKVGVGVSAPGFYWKYLEDGTKWIKPRPFVKPVHTAARKGAISTMRSRLRANVKRYLAKRKALR
jgi:HK97 gp10 family phage protein